MESRQSCCCGGGGVGWPPKGSRGSGGGVRAASAAGAAATPGHHTWSIPTASRFYPGSASTTHHYEPQAPLEKHAGPRQINIKRQLYAVFTSEWLIFVTRIHSLCVGIGNARFLVLACGITSTAAPPQLLPAGHRTRPGVGAHSEINNCLLVCSCCIAVASYCLSPVQWACLARIVNCSLRF